MMAVHESSCAFARGTEPARAHLADYRLACDCVAGVDEARLTTWMFTVIGRRIADFLRSPQRRQVASGVPGDDSFPTLDAASGPDAEQQLIDADVRSRLWREVARLTQPSRIILVRGRLALRARLKEPC